jgi:hypothetical protein
VGLWVGGYPINSFPRRWYRDRKAGCCSPSPAFVFVGLISGIITATDFFAANYRNVSWREMGKIAYDSAIRTAAVVFLLAVASVYQYLMGVNGVLRCSARCSGRSCTFVSGRSA